MAARIPKVGAGLFVSSVHWTVSGACLRRHFEKFGNVLYADVQIDVKTGLHQGYGWVRMSNQFEVQKILDHRRHSIEGYEANVKRDRRDTPLQNDHDLIYTEDLFDQPPSEPMTHYQTTPTTDHVTNTETTPTTNSSQ